MKLEEMTYEGVMQYIKNHFPEIRIQKCIVYPGTEDSFYYTERGGIPIIEIPNDLSRWLETQGYTMETAKTALFHELGHYHEGRSEMMAWKWAIGYAWNTFRGRLDLETWKDLRKNKDPYLWSRDAEPVLLYRKGLMQLKWFRERREGLLEFRKKRKQVLQQIREGR